MFELCRWKDVQLVIVLCDHWIYASLDKTKTVWLGLDRMKHSAWLELVWRVVTILFSVIFTSLLRCPSWDSVHKWSSCGAAGGVSDQQSSGRQPDWSFSRGQHIHSQRWYWSTCIKSVCSGGGSRGSSLFFCEASTDRVPDGPVDQILFIYFVWIHYLTHLFLNKCTEM